QQAPTAPHGAVARCPPARTKPTLEVNNLGKGQGAAAKHLTPVKQKAPWPKTARNGANETALVRHGFAAAPCANGGTSALAAEKPKKPVAGPSRALQSWANGAGVFVNSVQKSPALCC